MAQLTQREIRTLLRCLGEIYAHPDLDTFPTHLLTILPQVVPSEITDYNEVNLRRQKIAAVMEPHKA